MNEKPITLEAGYELLSRDARHWAMKCTAAEIRLAKAEQDVEQRAACITGCLDEIIALKAALAKAEEKITALETLRPYWAQGYSSDSIAAQTLTAALAKAERERADTVELKRIDTALEDVLGDLEKHETRSDAVTEVCRRASRASALEALLAECVTIIDRWHHSPNPYNFASMVALLAKLKART